jgi:hypothetical protein
MKRDDNIELTLPDFNLGTQAQRNAAQRLRVNYVQGLVDRGFSPVDIQILLHVRCVVSWWLDVKPEIMKFNRYLSAAKSLINQHGSVELASAAVRVAFEKELNAKEEYRLLSQPMFKYRT